MVRVSIAGLIHIQKMMDATRAAGGVDHNNLEEFHRAGVTCFGVGSNIVRKELLAAGNYAAIRENAMLYTEQAETW